MRVNLLGLALTLLFRRPLPDVLHDCYLQPLGSSGQWSWHGYDNSLITINGRKIQVVSGGAHWGGGVWMSADDLALLGQLYLQHGRWHGAQLVSEEWIERSWLPCAHKPEYGYLWWLNDDKRIFRTAPATGRCARGNADRHLLWVDPARDLVIASHWVMTSFGFSTTCHRRYPSGPDKPGCSRRPTTQMAMPGRSWPRSPRCLISQAFG